PPAERPASAGAGAGTVAPAPADHSAAAAAPSIVSAPDLGDLPLTVAAGAVAGAAHLRCGDAAWIGILSLERGPLLALDPAARAATTLLTLPGTSPPAALGSLPQPLPELPAGALYAVTSAGTLLAIDAAAFAPACSRPPAGAARTGTSSAPFL
ncbi:MAG TPA: hypothetical protein VHM02_00035, partial [Thermoanaerobaculia bacterium]|nr:hypothetical protein [Thermoanaerobaculia bacterium]